MSVNVKASNGPFTLSSFCPFLLPDLFISFHPYYSSVISNQLTKIDNQLIDTG